MKNIVNTTKDFSVGDSIKVKETGEVFVIKSKNAKYLIVGHPSDNSKHAVLPENVEKL